jgi:hypothetical protein
MDKSMMFGSARGGIYIHKNDEIYIPDYEPDQIFSATEIEFKTKLINALIKCYRTGLLVNVRRHIAVSKVSEFSEKCVFEWNNEQVSLAEAEIVFKTNDAVYYFKTSLIYNVFKYDYKPDTHLVANVVNQFS